MSKVYTNRSNATRAAKKQFGTDYTVTGSGKEWTVAPKAKAPRAKRAPGTRGEINPASPQNARALKLMRRANGVSVKEGAAILGVEQHTFRGLVSRLRNVVEGITVGLVFRTVRYHAPPDAA